MSKMCLVCFDTKEVFHSVGKKNRGKYIPCPKCQKKEDCKDCKEKTTKQYEQEWVKEAGSRCGFEESTSMCFDCKVVTTAAAYIKHLKKQLEKNDMPLGNPNTPPKPKLIVGICFECNKDIYEYDLFECDCNLYLHNSCATKCDQCEKRGCHICIPKDEDMSLCFCDTSSYKDEKTSECKDDYLEQQKGLLDG